MSTPTVVAEDWAAALPIAVLVAGTWMEDGVPGRGAGFAALLLTSYLLLHAARRSRTPTVP